MTNSVVFIEMDNAAYDHFKQERGQPWDRSIHARLLNRLADDGCAQVVLDTFFHLARTAEADCELVAAMRRHSHLVLMAEQSALTHPAIDGIQPVLPYHKFLEANGTNWGVAWLDPDPDLAVRRVWPFPSPGPYPSLPWAAAFQMNPNLDNATAERWIRYYGPQGCWQRISYAYAFDQPAGFYSNRIVFIGSHPKTTHADHEPDEFNTPYTRWTGETTGGVEIQLTIYLNLLNQDYLLRLPGWVEFMTIMLAGIAVPFGLYRLRLRWMYVSAGCLFILLWQTAICLGHFSHYWFPWLIIAGAQLPGMVIWRTVAALIPRSFDTNEDLPVAPGYQLVTPAFGSGAYGKVWLAKDRKGNWHALKAIYRNNFGDNSRPYDREYEGIKKYMPISDQHPGLLQVTYVSAKQTRYFYYVMELGDSVVENWQTRPARYQPRDICHEQMCLPGHRMPAKECIRIGIILCNALEFIHSRGMTHRDIKPQNIIYVNNLPKLADLGLVTEAQIMNRVATLVGTPGYMPPPPDHPGTISADIYALGMVLYVMASGKSPAEFPNIATGLAGASELMNFMPLNAVINKACDPDPKERYVDAAQMRSALQALLPSC